MSRTDESALPTAQQLSQALRADRPGLRRLLKRVQKARAEGRPHDRNLRRLTQDLARSVQLRRQRTASRPQPSYPPELPISSQRDTIAEALAGHQVVVVCGETGSGKSTQLPKILLELGYGSDGFIGHTQPRRIAARSLARRVAQELGSPLGQDVGFKVRFDDQTKAHTYVKFMTDGILLAETRADRQLDRYDAVIVDEAHERSLNVDFLLGYLKRLLPKRPDLRLVVTSATLDPERFSRFFSMDGKPAPIVEVSGRTWPVELAWRPLANDAETADAASDQPDEIRAAADAVQDVLAEADGDVLVFLPTERTILELAKTLRGRQLGRPVDILPLYARLPVATQQRIFDPGPQRRVVLATNVAESSVTVPRIRAVVDTGTARISRYSSRARIQRLPIEPISRAAADQRAGRCGRLGPGLCVRLYAEDDYAQREPFTTPEIQRCNLAAVMLQMKALRLGRVEDFPFLDPPKRGAVREGLRTLDELGALDANGELTQVGHTLARLPIDPRLGRIILAGQQEGCLPEMLILAAVLEVADPRERPPGKEAEADKRHARFAHEDSDILAFLGLWDHYQALREQHSRRGTERACRADFLNPARCREWVDVHRQLSRLAADAGLRPGRRRNDHQAIHRALLAGFLSHIAQRTGKYEYTGTDGKELYIWPGSALFDRKPRWIVATEMVETTRRYARNVARIDPRDAEPLARHLVERSHRDPHWDERTGHVMSYERVTLYGLPIVPKRLSRHDRVDPVLSRELFLRDALTEGVFDTGAPFLRHNLELVNAMAALEAKSRRRGLLADPDVRYDFYDRRIPPEVVGSTSFQRWRKKVERHDPGLLFMSRQDLQRGDVGDVTAQAYPDELRMGERRLSLRYRLAPGEEDDGVTLLVPLDALDELDEERLAWLVPGMLQEKVIALVRSLPKELRTAFVPVPTRAAAALDELTFGQGAFLPAVARALQRVAGQPVPPSAFDLSRVPDHLHMRLEVLDENAKVLAQGRDLARIRTGLGRRAHQDVAELADPAWRRDGLTRWDFGPLPEQVSWTRAGRSITAWPALVDRGDSVSLRLRARPGLARRETAAGLRRLVCLATGGRIRHRLEHEPAYKAMALQYATLGSARELSDQLVEAVAERAFLADVPPIRDGDALKQALTFGASRYVPVLEQTVAAVAHTLEAYHRVRAQLDEAAGRPGWVQALERMEAQLAALMDGDFVLRTRARWLEQLPRYLAAIGRRAERIASRGTQRDAELAAALVQPECDLAQLLARADEHGLDLPALQVARWMLEEYRVSVFAQELGTSIKVSAKRVAAQLDAARQELERALEQGAVAAPAGR